MAEPSWLVLAAVIAVSLALLLVVARLVVGGSWAGARRGRHASRPPRASFRRKGEGGKESRRKRAAVVINPTKFADVAAARADLTRACAALGWAEPLFIETTIEDPGTGQGRQAIEAGVDLVCPLGGDGTIRAVAVALAGTRTPMGLLPKGTGNLLARNLDVPVNDLAEALRIACTGRNKAIDVAWLELDPVAEAEVDDPGQAEEPVEGPPVTKHPFLVMAGMGFDAAIMEGTSEEMKAKVGWSAYFVTGFRSLFIKRFQVRYAVDGEVQPQVAARTIVFGSCGTLTGGITLMPQAEIDDGILDCVLVAPKTLVGWTTLAARVLRKSEKEMTHLVRTRGTTFTVEVDDRQQVQVDGDVVGEANRLRATVDKQALIVRVPA